MNPTWKAVAGVILVFILGWFGGALTTLAIAHHQFVTIVQHDPEQTAALIERGVVRGLGLDKDKRKQVHGLIVDNIRQRLALQRQIQPQVKSINGQTLAQINALLTPDQQKQLHDNLLRIKQRLGRNPFPVSEADAAAPAVSAPAPAK